MATVPRGGSPKTTLPRLTRRALSLVDLPAVGRPGGDRDPACEPRDFLPTEADWARRERELAAIRVSPPSPQRVARRVLCLSAAHARAGSETFFRADREMNPGEPTPEFWNTLYEALLEWPREEGLGDEMTGEEHAVLRAPLGTLEDTSFVKALWDGEAAVALLWALGRLEALPGYDREMHDKVINDHVPVLQSTTDFVGNATLRPEPDIAQARDLAQRWHWRARTTQIELERPNSVVHSEWFRREVLAATARDLVATGGVPTAIDGDFPAFGKAYSALTEREFVHCAWIAVGRHRALNWLCGYAENWDEVPTDT